MLSEEWELVRAMLTEQRERVLDLAAEVAPHRQVRISMWSSGGGLADQGNAIRVARRQRRSQRRCPAAGRGICTRCRDKDSLEARAASLANC